MTNAQVATRQLLWPLLPMLLRGQQHDLSPVVLALQVISLEEEQLITNRQNALKHTSKNAGKHVLHCCAVTSLRLLSKVS